MAACFRSNPRIVSVVGKDFSKNFFKELNKKGIDTSGLLVKDGKTFSWGGKYKSISEDPETKFTNLNVFENFQPIIPTSYKLKNKIVFLANIDPDLQNTVLDSLDSKKFIGMDTMNFWINSKRKSLDRAFNRINLLTINELELGVIYALICDAGTPSISDPGFLLVRECIKNNIQAEVLPGATAFVPALVGSGLSSEKFVFEGFLPVKKGRSKSLLRLAQETRTIILYESPHRILKTLDLSLIHI